MCGLVALATVLFFAGGRSDGGYGDFAPVFGSVRCVLDHCNPYSTPEVREELFTHGANASQYPDWYWRQYAMLYPPLTYDLLLPLGWMEFPSSSLAYFWLSGLLFACCMLGFVWLSPEEARTATAVGASCILATSGVLLRLGQVSTCALGLLVLGTRLALERPTRGRGAVLLCLAAGFKPQLALPMLVFLAIRRESRRAALGALAGFAAATALSSVLLSVRLGGTAWIGSLQEQVRFGVSLGPVQRIDTGIVNLSALTTLISASPWFYQTVDLAVLGGVAITLWIGYFRLHPGAERDWLAVAALGYLTLAVTYHRTYDMRLQLLALPGLVMVWRWRRWAAVGLGVLGGLQLFSTAIWVERAAMERFGAALAYRLWFRLLVERQQAVVVLAAVCGWTLVLWCRGVRRTEGPGRDAILCDHVSYFDTKIPPCV